MVFMKPRNSSSFFEKIKKITKWKTSENIKNKTFLIWEQRVPKKPLYESVIVMHTCWSSIIFRYRCVRQSKFCKTLSFINIRYHSRWTTRFSFTHHWLNLLSLQFRLVSDHISSLLCFSSEDFNRHTFALVLCLLHSYPSSKLHHQRLSDSDNPILNFNCMISKSLPPSVFEFNQILSLILKSEYDSPIVIYLFHQMEKRIASDMISYNTLLKSYVDLDLIDSALAVR